MGPKNKNKGGNKGGGKSKSAKQNQKKAVDDDDWEAILAEEAAQAPPPPETIEPKEEKPPPAPEEEEDQVPTDAAKKRRKKKKKKGGGDKGGNETVGKVSARGALIAERLRKQQEEEQRIAALEKAEEERLAEIERAEEEARQLKEKQRLEKKKRQKEKIEQQKKDGTYMTKKQKEKAKKDAERLEAMKAAGLTVPSGGKSDNKGEKKRVVYDNKKKGKGKKAPVVTPPPPPSPPSPPKIVEVVDDAKPEVIVEGTLPPTDDASSSGDDWDADSNSSGGDVTNALSLKLAALKPADDGSDEEDLIAEENRKEQIRLRELGLAIRRRKEEEERRQQELEAEESHLSQKAAELERKKEEGRRIRIQKEQENENNRSRDDLRCPIVVIMGHVDTGKTKLLDKIRKTNVQEGEAGGITQQIGATFFEKATLETQTKRLNEVENFDITLPGMLVIDTPGHESFSNLRNRGSNLCDIAILVVDLMHGLEPQTIESLTMLRQKKVPFVVALNKIDRCYAWVTHKDTPIREAIQNQPDGTVQEFRNRAAEAKLQLQEQGVNSNLYWEMGDEDWTSSDFVPMVPTSAISGEGVQDVLLLLCQMAQKSLWRKLMWCANLQCTVLEVKAIDGLGMTVDVLVVNGYLNEGDKAAFCTLDGPIVAEIRGLLTPPPSREMRIKSEYIHHKSVKGALGVKLIGNGLEKVMAGTPVMVVGPDDDEEDIKAEVMSDLTSLREKLTTDKKGVMVQASTLGALEALLRFLREDTQPPIPVSYIGIGTVHKKDVTKISVMNEKGVSEYATILAFDVDIETQAREQATELGVRIFTADIIYHLFDQFTRFMEELTEKRQAEAAVVAVFPCILKILPQHVFNQKDPIILGAEVTEGILKLGTPLCVPQLGGLHIGKVTGIEREGRPQETAKKGTSVAVKIFNEENPTITYGRQFDASHHLYSTLTRASINSLKENFKDKLEMEDWKLVVKLKKVFNII